MATRHVLGPDVDLDVEDVRDANGQRITEARAAELAEDAVPLEYGLRHGYTREPDDGRCVAVWIPPEQPMAPWRMVRSGMLAVPMRTGLGPLARFGEARAGSWTRSTSGT